MMKSIYNKFNYISEPHGAIGYLGLKKYGLKTNELGIFLETAHPVKFLDVVEETLTVNVEIPPQIKEVMSKEKVSILISNYQELKNFLNK
jgi:threonine synthase